MKRAISVIIFAVIVITVVGLIVMFTGNDAPSTGVKNVSSNSGAGQSSGSIVTIVTNESNTGSTTSSGKISVAELAIHNVRSDCWVSYKGKVYDITNWLPIHPGGVQAIERNCGTSTAFENAFTNKHGTSQVGRLMKEGNYKGDLE